MKLTTVIGRDGPTPAVLLTNDTLVDLGAASASGLVDGGPIRTAIEILTLDGTARRAVRRLVDRLEAIKNDDPLESARTYLMRIFDKQLPGTCPLGPVVVTADDFGDPGDVSVETRLNGEVMQSAHASDLVFPLAYTLSYFSRWFRFEPGDVLTTGSPPGFGYSRDPQRFLRPGDLIEVSSPQVGKLSNPVIGASD